MNLNQRNNEYDLTGSLTEEVIRIYGVPLKILLADRINKEDTFGDHSHIKLDSAKMFEVYGLPENSDDFNEYERLETQFGMPMGQTMDIFVSKITMLEKIQESQNSKNEIDITLKMLHKLLSSLIVLPGGKILEITNFDLDPPGLNNMFIFNKQKNVMKLMCKSYVHDDVNEIDKFNDKFDPEPIEEKEQLDINSPFDTLEKYFDELIDIKDKQSEKAEEFHFKEDNVFGRF